MLLDNPGVSAPKTLCMASGSIIKVDRGASDYPVRVERGVTPPVALWYAGSLPVSTRPAVAIVGSRAATSVGCERAASLAEALVMRGVDVISGGAFGIDAAAHEGALRGLRSGGAGRTYAVLGCGPDVVYPDRHAALFGSIAESGGLLAEHPPGTPPKSSHFPSRNRLIVALADAVVVVEAALRSGALITARLARQTGVTLLASAGSSGTDELLGSGGAAHAERSDDVFCALAGAPRWPKTTPEAPGDPAQPHAALIAGLCGGPADPAALARRMGRPLAETMGALAVAELDGWVRRRPGNIFEVVRGR